MENFVSIIIPTFNRSSLILRAIHSVLNQTHTQFEIIVVDDGSTDQTFSTLEKHIKSNVIKYIKQENLGVASARNTGVKNATGSLITFLDSDDEWLPNKLELQLFYLQSNQHINIVFTDEIWIRNKARVNKKKSHQKFGGYIYKNCVRQCFIAPSSVMLKKNIFEEVNGFDESFVVCEDYDLWLKISSLYEIGFIPQALIVKHGGHDDQLSTKFFAMDFWRIKSLLNILNHRSLTEEDKFITISFVKERGSILLNGYKKHGDLINLKAINEILNSFN